MSAITLTSSDGVDLSVGKHNFHTLLRVELTDTEQSAPLLSAPC